MKGYIVQEGGKILALKKTRLTVENYLVCLIWKVIQANRYLLNCKYQFLIFDYGFKKVRCLMSELDRFVLGFLVKGVVSVGIDDPKSFGAYKSVQITEMDLED